MGYEHGQYLKFENDVPLSNLFVTIQKAMGAKADSFADSTGEMKEVLSSWINPLGISFQKQNPW